MKMRPSRSTRSSRHARAEVALLEKGIEWWNDAVKASGEEEEGNVSYAVRDVELKTLGEPWQIHTVEYTYKYTHGRSEAPASQSPPLVCMHGYVSATTATTS